MKRFVIAVAVLALSGCATSGVRVTDGQLQQFHAGQTTKQQVIAALGEPTGTMRNADGTTTLTYTYVESSVKPTSFIPFVGLFAGGMNTHSTGVTLDFDKDGVLKNSTASTGQIGTDTGITAGAEPVKDQPRR
jgi:outer membrane protein assembly factor BamE (lipoprotein component of BamABCDE complex)